MINTREEWEICTDVWNVCCCVCFPVNLSAQSTMEQLLCTTCPTLWSHLSTPWPLVPLAGTRLHAVPWKDAGVCGHCWGSQGPGHVVESHLHVQDMTSVSALEPALWVTAQNAAALQRAHSSQSLRLLVTQNFYAKDINLNHFLWVNHFNLEPDNTDVCKMALLDAIYFCSGGNNVDWSHKKNYKT